MKETIIQFGTGNFLRGFVGHFIHVLNEKGLYDGKIVIVQPTKGGKTSLLNEQGGRYNLYLRGMENGEAKSERIEITAVSRGVDPYADYEAYLALADNPDARFIISNTTEAGIEFDPACAFTDHPALSFPGKLTQLLYRRFEAGLGGFVILPCELIDDNGGQLKRCVLEYAKAWKLGEDFLAWIERENAFCNTLVDRIVTGWPGDEADALKKEIGWDDQMIDTAERFHLWVIEGDYEAELPLKAAGFNVIWTDNAAPYKKMKVRILNGAHTSLVFPSLLAGIETVRESLEDPDTRRYLDVCLKDYILPILGENEETSAFAAAVLERFANPYIRHLWKSISLNSVSKYTARVLPTVKDYFAEKGEYPKPLIFPLACLIEYYRTAEPSDDPSAIDVIRTHSIGEILADTSLWGLDLSGAGALVNESLERIHRDGIREAMKWAIS